MQFFMRANGLTSENSGAPKVTTSNSTVPLPEDLSLPFFAYGLFRPGELAYPLIREFVDLKSEGVLPKAHFVRDGLALLHRTQRGKTKGFVLKFRSDCCQSAYKKIAAIEPWTQYKWGIAEVETETGMMSVNVLFGISPENGSEDGAKMNQPWSGRNDPLFYSGLEVVQEMLENAGEFDWNMKPTLRIQSAYLLLFSAIERFAAHACSLKHEKPVEKTHALARTVEFANALKAVVEVVEPKRKVRRSWDGEHGNLTLDPKAPVKSMDYYYQVRSTATHAGKTAPGDYDLLQKCTRELLEIFKRVRDERFANSADED